MRSGNAHTGSSPNCSLWTHSQPLPQMDRVLSSSLHKKLEPEFAKLWITMTGFYLYTPCPWGLALAFTKAIKKKPLSSDREGHRFFLRWVGSLAFPTIVHYYLSPLPSEPVFQNLFSILAWRENYSERLLKLAYSPVVPSRLVSPKPL